MLSLIFLIPALVVWIAAIVWIIHLFMHDDDDDVAQTYIFNGRKP